MDLLVSVGRGRPKFGLSETLAAIKKFIFVPGQRRPSTKLDLQSFFSRGTSEGCWELFKYDNIYYIYIYIKRNTLLWKK